MDRMLEIISILNLLPRAESKRFNELVKEGYQIIKEGSINETIINTFLVSINDAVKYSANINSNLEPREYLTAKVLEQTVMIDSESIIFSEPQKYIYQDSFKKENMIFSLPTSAGKSFVIRKIAIERASRGKRTIIITPTLSLLNEYRAEISKSSFFASTSEGGSGMIFTLTQERAVNFAFNDDDLLIIDEAYVIAALDSRAGIMIHVIKSAVQHGASVKMFLPNIKNSKNIFKISNFKEIFTSFEDFRSLSARERNIINKSRKEWFNCNNFDKKSVAIFDIQQKKWREIFDSASVKVDWSDDNSKIKSFLELEFGPQFKPIKYLEKGVVFSHSKYPKIFRYFSEIFFKERQVRFIVSTSTITKGVNLKPDEIAIFAKNAMGKGAIDLFELRNAAGRVGRYSKNIEDRIGVVNLVGTGDTYKIFKENQDVIMGDYIDSSQAKMESEDIINDLLTYDFNDGDNFDWVKGKFGIAEKELLIKFKGMENVLKPYIEFKYGDGEEIDYNAVWDLLTSIDGLKIEMLKIGVKKVLDNYYDNVVLSQKQKRYILDTFKYQGFIESIKPSQTFFKSAVKEYKVICEREIKLCFENDKITLSNGYEIKSDISESQKNEVIDALIYRKNIVNNVFVEAFLSPLDTIIGKAFGIEISVLDNLDLLLEQKGIPSELKQYIIHEAKKNKEGITYEEYIDENELMQIIIEKNSDDN